MPHNIFGCLHKILVAFSMVIRYHHHSWGRSSVGRARRSHRRGHGFDTPWLHHFFVEIGHLAQR